MAKLYAYCDCGNDTCATCHNHHAYCKRGWKRCPYCYSFDDDNRNVEAVSPGVQGWLLCLWAISLIAFAYWWWPR